MSDVRAAQVEDAAAIARVHVAAWQWAYRGIMPDEYLDGLDPARRIPMWEASIARPSGAVFVAEAGGELVGFAHVAKHEDDDEGELHAIYLLHEATGRGLGRALMEASERALGDLGCSDLVLWVATANTSTRRFYEQAGWQSDGAASSYELPGFGLPVVRYRKHLEPAG